MATIHIGIGHDDDLVIAQLLQVQGFRILLGTYGHTHSSIDVLDLLALEHLVIHRFLHIQDLTAQGEDRLECAVTSLLGCTTCGVSLDQEQLTNGGIFGGTIGQLAGKSTSRER